MHFNTYGGAPTRATPIDADMLGADLPNHRRAEARTPEPQPQSQSQPRPRPQAHAAPDGAGSSQGDEATSSADWCARCGHDAHRFRRVWSRETPAGTPHPASPTPQSFRATVGSLAQRAGLSERHLLAGAAILGVSMLARGGLNELANVGRFVGHQLGASLVDTLFGTPWNDVYRPAAFGPCASRYVGPFTRQMTACPAPAASWLSSPWSEHACAPGWGLGFGIGQPGGCGGCGAWGGLNGWAPW